MGGPTERVSYYGFLACGSVLLLGLIHAVWGYNSNLSRGYVFLVAFFYFYTPVSAVAALLALLTRDMNLEDRHGWWYRTCALSLSLFALISLGVVSTLTGVLGSDLSNDDSGPALAQSLGFFVCTLVGAVVVVESFRTAKD